MIGFYFWRSFKRSILANHINNLLRLSHNLARIPTSWIQCWRNSFGVRGSNHHFLQIYHIGRKWKLFKMFLLAHCHSDSRIWVEAIFKHLHYLMCRILSDKSSLYQQNCFQSIVIWWSQKLNYELYKI